MRAPQLLLVTGKGGVGKSAIAAGAALKLSKEGHKVLLAELGEKSFFQYVFDQPVGYRPQETKQNLWLCLWEGEECLKEYIAHLLKIERIVNLFFENKVMKALVQAAPALKELAILGKLTSPHRKVGPALDFDYIILDAYSTGHFKALLQAPRGMGEAIPFGPMGEQCRSIDRVIHNKELTKIWVVTLPEELPVVETQEHMAFLKQEMGLSPQAVLNRCLEAPLEGEVCEELLGEGLQAASTDFVAYLCSEEQKNRMARKKLAGELVVEVPHLLRGMSTEMLETLAERLPHPWKNS